MTVRRIFNWIVGLPIAIVAVVFAVANRQWITVSFDPFNRDQPFASVNMPLWALFFCGVFAGIFAGWLVAWIAQGKWRRAAKDARLEAIRLGNDNDKLKREQASRSMATTQDSSL